MNEVLLKLDIKKKLMSGWQDSNLRPPRPKRGAITGLRYTPNHNVCKFIKENHF